MNKALRKIGWETKCIAILIVILLFELFLWVFVRYQSDYKECEFPCVISCIENNTNPIRKDKTFNQYIEQLDTNIVLCQNKCEPNCKDLGMKRRIIIKYRPILYDFSCILCPEQQGKL